MTPAEGTAQRLYESIKRGDAATATECYCDDATYQDIAFDLKGKENIAAMWRLVCSREVKVEYGDIRTEGSKVKGHWVFDYKFHGTNPVHNEMNSTFTFRDGKIATHHDSASRWKWAKQALGIPKGALVTVLPFILRIQAKKELEASKAKEKVS
jgi:ketosteroid isomerase-like protein